MKLKSMGWWMADFVDDILRFVDYIPVCPFSYLSNAILAILSTSHYDCTSHVYKLLMLR